MTDVVKLAVFGNPVAHSLSPVIHSGFGRQTGHTVDYRRIQCDVDQLEEQIAAFAANGGIGANLTLPLKLGGLRLCRQLDRAARQGRAVNTLHLVDGNWHGFNTDGAGLLLDLERLKLGVRHKRVLILGAGGATAGLIGPLLAAGPAQVLLLNRTESRAIELAERFEHLGPVSAANLESGPLEGDFDLLIQATSLGHSGSLPDIDRQWLRPSATVYDLNYGNAHRPLADWCQQQGFGVHDGLGMLVGQAALAFEIWTGTRPAIEPSLQALRTLPKP
jgi:shikimate dehydrogenase